MDDAVHSLCEWINVVVFSVSKKSIFLGIYTKGFFFPLFVVEWSDCECITMLHDSVYLNKISIYKNIDNSNNKKSMFIPLSR